MNDLPIEILSYILELADEHNAAQTCNLWRRVEGENILNFIEGGRRAVKKPYLEIKEIFESKVRKRKATEDDLPPKN